VPEGATPEQGVRVVIKYIEARPERMQEPFGKLALEALGRELINSSGWTTYESPL
jgi:hypothetical protein